MIIALAKKEEIIHSPYTPEPVSLPSNHGARKLLERIRDEVHRFAISFHRKKRDSALKMSVLDSVPDLGPAKTATLLKNFGSVKRLREASLEDITSLKGFSGDLARTILDHLNRQ
jgi:excinuclease ABC subunit C